MSKITRVLMGSLLLIALSGYANNCPIPNTIKCDSNTCKTTDPNFTLSSYVKDAHGKYNVSFYYAGASCSTTESSCNTPFLWGKFRCFYHVGNNGLLILQWQLNNYVPLQSPPWNFYTSEETATCNTDVKICSW